MNSYIDLVQKTNGQFTAQLYELQLSDKLKTDMDKPFCKPFNLYELSVADQLMSFDDVRRIFAMYEKTLRLKDNLIANLLEKCRLLEQENQEWQQQAQRVPLLEEHIKFLEEHESVERSYPEAADAGIKGIADGFFQCRQFALRTEFREDSFL